VRRYHPSNARVEGNVWRRPTPVQGQPPAPPEPIDVKWTDPEWTLGDVDAGFKKAALVLDETFITPNTSHQCLESRSSMAYWQNGKLYIHSGHTGNSSFRIHG
jgi:CO/xanthine dehydrogenase Mo-binding subunit